MRRPLGSSSCDPHRPRRRRRGRRARSPGEAPLWRVLNWYVYGDPVGSTSTPSRRSRSSRRGRHLLRASAPRPRRPRKITGDLAERWTVSADGKTYTFHLRKGVKWHDGQPFTAADVKATLRPGAEPGVQEPALRRPCSSPLVASVEGWTRTPFQVRLKFPAAPFLSTWPRPGAGSPPSTCSTSTGTCPSPRPRSAPAPSSSSATSGAA